MALYTPTLIMNLIDRSGAYFTANGRNRNCYFRLVDSSLRHPIYGYEMDARVLLKFIYCINSENEDLFEHDSIIYKAKNYRITGRTTKANNTVLVLEVQEEGRDSG